VLPSPSLSPHPILPQRDGHPRAEPVRWNAHEGKVRGGGGHCASEGEVEDSSGFEHRCASRPPNHRCLLRVAQPLPDCEGAGTRTVEGARREWNPAQGHGQREIVSLLWGKIEASPC